jgi:hypothetical protein
MSAERAPIKVLLRGEHSVLSMIESGSVPGFGGTYSRTRIAVGCAGSMK